MLTALQSPLVAASRKGHIQVVQLMLKHSANINAKDRDMSALHSAAQEGHTATILALLNAGAEVNAKNAEGRTALHYAAGFGHQGAVRALLDASAEATAADDSKEQRVRSIPTCQYGSHRGDSKRFITLPAMVMRAP